MSAAGDLVRRFIESYDQGRLDAELLAEDLLAAVTMADGSAQFVRGRDQYLAMTPDLQAADGSATLTQVLDIDADHVLAMVEIHAARHGRRLHNFAAFLVTVRDGTISELWMVDGKPAESDAFWQ